MKTISSVFLNLILAVIIAISATLIIYFSQIYQSKYSEELEKIRFNQEVYDLAKQLASCLGYEYEETYYLDYNKIEEFSKEYKDIEPRCAIAKDFDYNVKIIQLEKEIRNYPIQIETGGCGWSWVVNSGSGVMHSSVSLVNSDGTELRRHYTDPNMIGNPSRTAVDKYGNIWVGNRGSNLLVKIAFDKNKCNGQTSEDVNGDGKVDANEMVSFDSDGCILQKIVLPCKTYVYIRAVCIDNDQLSVYAGCFDDRKFFKISEDGQIVKSWDLPARPYGCVVDNDGNVWIASLHDNTLVKLNPQTNEIKTFSFSSPYGIWRCYNKDCIVFSSGGSVVLFNTTSTNVILSRSVGNFLRGVFVDTENNIYAADSGGNKVYKLDTFGNLLKFSKTCNTPTGISMDACGNLWVQCMDGGIYIFDRDLNLINFFIIPGIHYTYSDFTGFLSEARVQAPIKIEPKILKIESKEFSFGLLEKGVGGVDVYGPKINLKTQVSIPILIKYNETFIVDGLLIINAYKGFLEEFYSYLDDLCSKDLKNFESTKQFYFDYDVKIEKENDYYKVCSEDVCKKLICNYEIENKEFKKGENIISFKILEDKLLIS